MVSHTTFISKKIAERITNSSTSRVLISIITPYSEDNDNLINSRWSSNGSKAKITPDAWKDVLFLEFHDVDCNPQGFKYTVFDENLSQQIIDFCEKHKDDVDQIIVHCEAGISRSAGVSKFIAMIYNLDFPSNYMLYNKLVFSTLLRTWGKSQY